MTLLLFVGRQQLLERNKLPQKAQNNTETVCENLCLLWQKKVFIKVLPSSEHLWSAHQNWHQGTFIVMHPT